MALAYHRAVNLIGRQIGSYVVERELGAGGTGTVYLCNHTLIERRVAVKVLHDDLAYQPDQVARFFQEAKSAADIGHPNIVVIIDFGELTVANGVRSYLMMECLDGGSLDKKLRTESFTLEQIAHILAQICSALQASHGKGIIHRDLKPANVQLCPRSFDPYFVKLLDFGIAKLATPSPDARRTQYGVVIGTPAYMSPEQCEGKGALDHRSDIYSLGVMLYEMLTGTVPYDGEIRDILMGHLMSPPVPPSQRNPAVPPEWEALCLHMMEKSRDARFQSVSEIAQVLLDLPRHASAYSSYVTARSARSQSGFTMKLDGPTDPQGAAARPTMHAGITSSLTSNRSPADASQSSFNTAQPGAQTVAPPLQTSPTRTASYGADAHAEAPFDAATAPTIPPEGLGALPDATSKQIIHPSAAYPAYREALPDLEALQRQQPLPEPNEPTEPTTPTATAYREPAEDPLDTAGTSSNAAGSAAIDAAAIAAHRPSSTASIRASNSASLSATGHPVVRPDSSLAGGQATPMIVPNDGSGMAACYALVTDPRHHRFLATLLVRPPGRWFNVAELCSTSQTAAPATLPPQPLFCSWMDHPWADPAMAAVVFVSLNDGSNTVALCRRVSW